MGSRKGVRVRHCILIVECPNCGGDIVLPDEKVVVCEECDYRLEPIVSLSVREAIASKEWVKDG